VRSVARALVHGHDRADELEQETWVAALSHPPRHGGDVRRWFSAVARNVSRHLFRSGATREHHERRNAELSITGRGSSVAPGAGAIVARAEVLQRVAAAVLALEEPYRSALLARYFDELPPIEIARALDVSVETVKTRLKRGLAQLRERLESLRPEGTTLEAVLLPLCGPAVGAAWPAVTKGLLVAATLAIGATILVPRVLRAPIHEEVVAGAVDPAAAVAAASAVAPAPAAGPQDAAPAAREPIRASTPPLVADGAKRADARARVVGRIALPDGRGAADVSLRLTGSESDGERALKYGVPDDWKPVESRSSADGSFSIEFPAPRAFQYVLEAKLAGLATVRWKWFEFEPGTIKDVGEVMLLRTGTVHGRIVDGSGRAVRSSRWVVYADSPDAKVAEGLQAPRVFAVADATSREFVLEDVPPGTFALSAESPLAGRIAGPSLEVHIGERTEAEIVVRSPDLAHRITIDLSSSPYDVFTSGILEDAAPKIVLTGNGIDPRDATPSDSLLGSYVFDDIPDGRYTVEVNDPKYLPWRKSDVANGASIVAKLSGNAGIRLMVVDATSGKEIPRYSLRTRFEFEGNVRPDTVELLRQGAEPPRDGVYDGLIPVNQVLQVGAPGCAECSLPLRPLAADRVTEITARLTQGATLSGIVLRSDGTTPSPYTPVHLEPRQDGTVQQDDTSYPGTGATRGTLDVSSDDTGKFWFHNIHAGHFTIRTGEDDPALEARIEDVEVRDDTPSIEKLRLVLPPSGFLSGRLVLPPDARLDGLEVVAVPLAETDEERWDRWSRVPRSAILIGPVRGMATRSPCLQPDGTFRIGPLAPGRKRVRLRLPVVASLKNGSTGLGLPAEIDLARFVESREGSSTSDPDSIDTVTIVDGEEVCADFDARPNFPGRLRIVAELRGAPAEDVFVQAIPVDLAADASAPKLRVERFAIGQLDAHGSATLAPIPATQVRLFFTTTGSPLRALGVAHPWCWLAPGVYEVASNVESEVPVVIEFAAGDVLVVDPAGKLVTSHWFDVGCDDVSIEGESFSVMTDPEGRLHLRLPPGRYRIRGMDWKSRKEPAASFEWTQYGLASDAIHVVKPG
jgi:RNA polymerase sigma-70 factor (ECF subfamily)